MWKGRQSQTETASTFHLPHFHFSAFSPAAFSRCDLDRPERDQQTIRPSDEQAVGDEALFYFCAPWLYISVLCLHKSEVRQIALECVNQRSWAGQAPAVDFALTALRR